MPKKAEKKSALDLVSWIDGLPDKGGPWGKGIIDTVMSFEKEAEEADSQIAKLEEQVKAMKDRAAQRRTMAIQTARRAGREAQKLYGADDLKKAGLTEG
ncbi:MAG: hypothetical protein LC118_09265 [Dehalococcoidia bacterium]|nr:hypothetical protein [Dehalococcoidia bacterium]